MPQHAVQLLRGEQYTLVDNTDPYTWVVQGQQASPSGPQPPASASQLRTLKPWPGLPGGSSQALWSWSVAACPLPKCVTAGPGESMEECPSLTGPLFQACLGAAGTEAETDHSSEPPGRPAKEPLRPSQQGTEGWPGKEGGIEIGVDAYSGYPGAAGRGDPELKALIWGFHSLGWQA